MFSSLKTTTEKQRQFCNTIKINITYWTFLKSIFENWSMMMILFSFDEPSLQLLIAIVREVSFRTRVKPVFL